MEKAKAGNIQSWLEAINRFNSTPGAGTTRVLFTQPELEAREYLKNEMRSLGLIVKEDSIGNIFGTLKGRNAGLSPVWTGSHIDTVLNAGMFDGMAGVAGGLEAVRIIKESGEQHERDITVVIYTSEEPARFGISCLGSRALGGMLALEDTKQLFDKEGSSLYDVLASLNYDLSEFDSIPVGKGEVFAAVELHIEQSGSLEKKNIPVGIVKSICAPSTYRAEVTGRQSHAGGTSMSERRDAFAACCEIALVLEHLAKTSESEYATATVGYVNVIPGAENVIPGKVCFSIDIRDSDYSSKRKLTGKLQDEIREIEKRRGVSVSLTPGSDEIPAVCDPAIIQEIRKSCEKNNTLYTMVISGAYHDSMIVSSFAPVGMIFVPSKNGISHSPDEWTDFQDIAKGVDVLAETLLNLANK